MSESKLQKKVQLSSCVWTLMLVVVFVDVRCEQILSLRSFVPSPLPCLLSESEDSSQTNLHPVKFMNLITLLFFAPGINMTIWRKSARQSSCLNPRHLLTLSIETQTCDKPASLKCINGWNPSQKWLTQHPSNNQAFNKFHPFSLENRLKKAFTWYKSEFWNIKFDYFSEAYGIMIISN